MAHHFLMRAMHPVKVTHADYGGTEVRRDIIEMAKNLHDFLGPGAATAIHSRFIEDGWSIPEQVAEKLRSGRFVAGHDF
jgi:hypothetical protein